MVKQDVKVKSYVRKGKLVKNYQRKQNILQKVGLTLGGIAALTGTTIAGLKIKHYVGINNAANLIKKGNFNLNKINNNKPIIYTVSGLRTTVDDYMVDHVKELFPDFNIISLPLTFNVGKGIDLKDAIKRYIKPLITKGYNPDSLELAKNVYAQYKVNPNNTYYLVGHSAGGVTTNHAQEILNKLGVKTKVVNTGSYYSKIENLSKTDNFTILGKDDNVVKPFYSHNPIMIEGGHNPYGKGEVLYDKNGNYYIDHNVIPESHKQWEKQMRKLIK
jgi:hypothetical protein